MIPFIAVGLQFSLIYFGLVAFQGSTFTRYFIITSVSVKCCVAPRLHLSVVIFFLVHRDQWLQYIGLRIEYRLIRYYGCDMLHLSLSLMNRLNKTGPTIFTYFLWHCYCRGST